MKHVKLYTFKCDWVYESKDNWEDKTARGIVCADSYSEAVEKIVQRLPHACSIFVDEAEDNDFIFLSKDNYKRFRDYEYGLEDEDEVANEW